MIGSNNSVYKDTLKGEKLQKQNKKSYEYYKDLKMSAYKEYSKDKDLDNEDRYGKHSSSKSQKSADSRGKAIEQQPEKMDKSIRLEKEKKALERKNQELEDRFEKPKRKIRMKQRRTKTIDWTKGYAQGLYGDDDEDYTEYM